jgi:hypothetical protein
MKINKIKPQRRFETIVGSGVIIDRDGQVPPMRTSWTAPPR